MKGTGGGLSTLKFVQIKTGSEVPLTRVRNAWLETERTHITEVFTDTGLKSTRWADAERLLLPLTS